MSQSNIHTYTSITANYLPKARVLAESIKKHCPGVMFHLVISDDLPEGFDLEQENFDTIIFAEDFKVDNFKQWVFGHRVVELCTAVKGLALEYIFETHGADKVFYFDPDMALFDTLDELSSELDEHAVVLTPHQTEPETSDEAIIDNELCSLRFGVFNLGFVGVANRPEGRRFAQWWRDRLLKYCHDDHPRGLFTDQKWVNLAPCYFDDLKVLRKPIFNVATWNITHRELAGTIDGEITVNGLPLCFYHFSGFDSGGQESMLKKYGKKNQTLWDLRNWYIEQCDKNQQQELGKLDSKYAFFDDGSKIEDKQRLCYRERIDLQEAFPDPFVTSQGGYKDKGYKGWAEVELVTEPNVYGMVTVLPGAGFKVVMSDMSHYFDDMANSHRASSGLKKYLLKAFAFGMRSLSKLLP